MSEEIIIGRNKAILEASPDLVFRVSRDGVFLDFQDSDDGKLYAPREAIVGSNLRDVMPQEIADQALHRIARTLDTGEMQVYEYRLAGPEDALGFEARMVVSGPNEVLCFVRDITERMQAEEMRARFARQAELRATVSIALAESGTLQSMLQRCAESMIQHLDAAFARVWTLNDKQNVLELQASAGLCTHLDGPHGRVPVGELKIGLIAQERQPHLTNDVLGDPRISDKGWVRRKGIVAFAGYPLVVEDRLVGVMAMFARKPLAEDAIEALASVADTIAQGIERKRTEEELRESEERHRAVVDTATDAIITMTTDGLIRSFNPAAERIFGYSAEEIVDQPLKTLMPERFRGPHEVGFRRYLETGEARIVGKGPAELAGLRKDGAEFPLELSLGEMREDGDILFAGTIRDITERKRAEQELQRSQSSLAAAQRIAHLGNWEYEVERDEAQWSDEMYRIFGFAPQRFTPTYKTFLASVHPDDKESVRRTVRDSLYHRIQNSIDYRIVRPNGEVRWVNSQYETLRNATGRPTKLIGTVYDFTDRKRAEEALHRSEERFRALVEQAADALFVHDLNGRFIDVNRQACESLGYTRDELLTLSVADIEQNIEPGGFAELWQRVISEGPVTLDGIYRRKNGTRFPVEVHVGPLEMEGPQLMLAAARDITERKAFEQQLEHQALHDDLTGLPNRILFLDRLEQALARAGRRGGKVAVLFMDLDNFKIVNDSLGHQAGDRLLTAVAKRLQLSLRPEDTFARLGGDEFIFLVEDVTEVSNAAGVAERITEQLQASFSLGNQDVHITTSIGIVLSASSDDHPNDLLRRADVAMYRAKARGKAHYEVFEEAMDRHALERLKLESDLRRAIERNELRIHYHPMVQLDTNLQQSFIGTEDPKILTPVVQGEYRVREVEALLRWEHPERGLTLPSKFIPIAEETGLIVPIGRWVLEEACRQARAWQERYPSDPPFGVCVNLSARQLQQPGLVDEVAGILRETALDPRSLLLEITESAVMEDMQSSIYALQELKRLGVQLALDDFGTGYSSLSYLKRFPVDFLKIDTSLTQKLERSSEDTAIVSAIIDLAHALDMKVVAEGVETTEELAKLRSLGCDLAQGHYFSKPLPDKELDALLATNPQICV